MDYSTTFSEKVRGKVPWTDGKREFGDRLAIILKNSVLSLLEKSAFDVFILRKF